MNDLVAIVGMSCRLPGGITDPEGLWAALREGKDLVGETPPDRYEVDRFVHPEPDKPGRIYTKSGAFLTGIANFDAAFFGISPREANSIDPQQRLLLEMTVEALDDAGIDGARLAGSDTAVYVGVSGSDYLALQQADPAGINAYTNAGGALSITANRISYTFDLRGPSMAIDTACSSSLVALHQACQSLRGGESRVALAAGVNVLLSPYPSIGFSKASMLSRRGRCQSFAEGADGYVRAEGGGVVVLKPLADAQRDGDRIHAVIRATGINADGRTVGLSLPSAEAQEALLRRVYQRAAVSPAELVYIEAHGTGTVAGDPIECHAIGQALGRGRPAGAPLPIGSVKSNLGHLEPASGMAGLLKALLILRHREIPKSLHGLPLNPSIDFAGLNLAPVTEPIAINGARNAVIGVNSFGFGGANAHVVLSDPPPPAVAEAAAVPGVRALVISAHTPAALAETARRFDEHLAAKVPVYDACYTSCLRRSWREFRFAALGRSDDELRQKLHRFALGEVTAGAAQAPAARGGSKLAFVFSGNGSQWAGMAGDLLEAEPVFQRRIEEIDAQMRPALGWSVIDELRSAPQASRLSLTEVAQPALFAVQLGLAAVLRARGFEPAAVFGHSVGEVAAAQVCGALNLADAVRVIVERSRAQALTAGTGRMAAVGLSAADAQASLRPFGSALELAAVNGDADVTIAGDAAALAELGGALERQGVFFRDLGLNYAFHSRHMDPVRTSLLSRLGGVAGSPGYCAFVSTVTGAPLDPAQLDADYWWANVRKPVLFAQAARHLAGEGFGTFVEIGPHPVLKSYLRRLASTVGGNVAVVATLQRGGNGTDDLDTATAALLAAGTSAACEPFFPRRGRVVDLPAQVWQRDHHWSGSPGSWLRSAGGTAAIDHPLLGSRLPSQEPTWAGRLDPGAISWLPDHKVGDAVVMPAVGYVEMALAAGKRALGAAVEIVALNIPKALTLRDDLAPELQVALSAEGAFRVASRGDADGEWQLHAHGRVQRSLGGSAGVLECDALHERLTERWTGERFYEHLAATGLPFGPAFRLIDRVSVGAGEALATYSSTDAPFANYEAWPPLVDAGLQAVLPLCVQQSGTDLFLPSTLGRVRCWKAPAAQGHVHVRLLAFSGREIRCDVTIAHPDGSVAMTLEDCRFRRFPAFNRRAPSLLRHELRALPRPGSSLPAVPMSPAGLAAQLKPELEQLKAHWRTANHYDTYLPRADALCAHFAARGLKNLLHDAGQPFGMEDLLNAGVASRHERLLHALVAMAQADGFLQREGGRQWRLVREPAPQSLMPAMLRDFPEYAAELLLLGRCGMYLSEVLRGERNPLELIFPEQGMATAEHLYDTAPGSRFYNALLRVVVRRLVAAWPDDRPLRIVEMGGGTGGLTAALLPLLPPERTHYLFTDVSDAFLTRAQGRFQEYGFVDYRRFDVEREPEGQGLALQAFDIVLAANVLHATADLQRTLTHAGSLLAPGGLLLGLEKHEERTLLLIFGLLDGWWRFTDAPVRQTSPLLPAHLWPQILRDAGFDEVSLLNDAEPGGASQDSVLMARRPARHPARGASASMLPRGREDELWIVACASADDRKRGDGLARALAEAACTAVRAHRAGQPVPHESDVAGVFFDDSDDWAALIEASAAAPARVNVVYLAGEDAAEAETAALGRAMHLRAISRALAQLPARVGKALWLVTGGHGALPTLGGTGGQHSLAAIWGAMRSLGNEVPEIEVRRLLAGPQVDATLLAGELLAPGAEDEIVLTGPGGRFVPRVTGMTDANTAAGSGHRPASCALKMQDQRVSYRLKWQETPLPHPGPGEVAIEVKAAGLNYRDVLWAMGMLSEEAGAEGYFGGELGMECAGVVTAVGTGVDGFTPGDRVYAFAPASLASHTLAEAGMVGRLPDAMSFAEGATLPVVFVTVHYALAHLARLEPCETIVIHGAAGGVGLAAVQYAQAVGARVIATAGTPEKRDLLRLLGVEHVFDSRSLRFADEIMALTAGRGVDVVLNSLAGEAIIRNLDILKPFGRFVELGKRDIYGDSRIGLRPFRKNLSFFGVDADKLKAEPALAHRLFGEVAQRIAGGEYRPLLHRSFPAGRVEEAFKLLQNSRHIGKVVVLLDESQPVCRPPKALALDPQGVYLVTGGLGGFGAATAQWLAGCGARHLALVSRRGAQAPEAQALLQALARNGVSAHAFAADAANPAEMQGVMQAIDATGLPLRGVVHAAMVLDDASLADLSAERFQAALAPKLQGGLVLDQLTRDRQLDLFVVFCSVTAVFGNPGQSNYAAGNLALESLVRARRKAGLPGLAVAWGTISETGYVARRAGLAEAAQRSLGIAPLSPAEALDALGRLLAGDAESAIVAHCDWTRMRQSLPALAAPRFLGLVPANPEDAMPDNEDLQKSLAALAPAQALARVEQLTARLVADIFRTSPERIDHGRRLSDLGMDSLMAVELQGSLSRQFACDLPVMQIVGGGVRDLAARIAARIGIPAQA